MKPWICLDIFAKLFKMKKRYSISSIQSDHGKEFENLGFDKFCGENEISHNFFTPKTLQQNRVVERRNRILEEWLEQCFVRTTCQNIFG